MEEKDYWLGFALCDGIGPKRMRQLLTVFGSAKSAWEAKDEDLNASGIGEKVAHDFCLFRRSIILEKEHERLSQKRISFVARIDPNYPPLLQQIATAPIGLFYSGSLRALATRTIAIVGTRRITTYGEKVTQTLTKELVSAGFTIVSGLAYGVDALAHRTAIQTNGLTVAVLGCGVDCCTPKEHESLYRQIIASGGAIVSEYPPGAPPIKGSFPSRNRIIAGLSEAVIMTEGSIDSGALYTARAAFESRRPVFAVPGQITSSLAQGPLSLVRQGAELLTSATEVGKRLGQSMHSIQKKREADSPEEHAILDLLENEELHADEIARKLKMKATNLSPILTVMEVKGMVVQQPTGLLTIKE